MKKIFAFLVLAFILLCVNKVNAQDNNSASVLRHIVIITFKPDAPADSVKVLDELYSSLSKSSFVKSFEMGVNISTRDTGVVKHVYVTSFASKEDMEGYRKIPEYAKLFKVSLPIAGDVTVADYWTNKY